MAKRKMTTSAACAACRMQRKRCSEDCVLAPHFPSDDPDKFAIVQRVFGTSHIVRLLQGIKAEQREEAVKSMVFEAKARIEDPVRGSANAIEQLQKQIAEMKTRLENMREELTTVRSKYDKILLLLHTGSLDAQNAVYPTIPSPQAPLNEEIFYEEIYPANIPTPQPTQEIFYEEIDPILLWDPLWEL